MCLYRCQWTRGHGERVQLTVSSIITILSNASGSP